MAHVTFIHGIGNKPEKDKLLEIWQRVLAEKLGIDLNGEGVTSSLVYWADVLYAAPDPDVAAHERILESTLGGVDAKANPGPPPASGMEEAVFLTSLAAKIGGTLAAVETVNAMPSDRTGGSNLERIPLPWFVKKAFLENFLSDVHHYLFDVEFSPRPGTTYRVQQEIRRRFVAQLAAVPQNAGPHVVISHSMGTVIAYDCLKRVAECAAVDALMTIGSPLGLDEIQDKLQPGWTRPDGFPSAKVLGAWINVFDRLDPVAGFDPFLENDYRKGGEGAVRDIEVQNDGSWRHSMVKYLRQEKLRRNLKDILGL
jgi:hypothetical protein